MSSPMRPIYNVIVKEGSLRQARWGGLPPGQIKYSNFFVFQYFVMRFFEFRSRSETLKSGEFLWFDHFWYPLGLTSSNFSNFEFSKSWPNFRFYNMWVWKWAETVQNSLETNTTQWVDSSKYRVLHLTSARYEMKSIFLTQNIDLELMRLSETSFFNVKICGRFS